MSGSIKSEFDDSATDRAEDGSAVAESVMIMSLIVLVFTAVIQFGVIIHTYNTMIDAASAGARHASLADRSAEDGRARAQELLTAAIPGSGQSEIVVSSTVEDEAELIVVTIRHHVPIIGFMTGPVPLEVNGRAYAYR